MEDSVTQPPEYYFNAYFSKTHPTHFFHKSRIDKLVSLVPEGSKVLDTWCGSGILAHLLERKGCDVTGIDIREVCIDFAKKKTPNARFYTGNLLDFDLKEEFDFIVCSDVIEHFEDDKVEIVIENIRNHLKIKGTLILMFPSYFYYKIESIWKIIRSRIYPNTVFDDDEHHADNYIAVLTVLSYSFEVQESVRYHGLLSNYLIAKRWR